MGYGDNTEKLKHIREKEGLKVSGQGCEKGSCGCKKKCKHPPEKVYSMLVSRALNHPKKEGDFGFPENVY